MMRFMVVIELIHRCFWAFTTSTPSFKFPAQVVADILCNSQLLLPLLSKHIRAVLISSHDCQVRGVMLLMILSGKLALDL
jgi:hypothetical protein